MNQERFAFSFDVPRLPGKVTTLLSLQVLQLDMLANILQVTAAARGTCHPVGRREGAAGNLPENGLVEGVPSMESDAIPKCWNQIFFKVPPKPFYHSKKKTPLW